MAKPAHLEPSKLGTREYWDALYTTEIANYTHDPSDTGTAWFDDSDAEARLIQFLEDAETERGAELGLGQASTSFLDLGTGNGALLFALRDAGWRGPMLGVDYSAHSVRFARRIERARRRERVGGDDDNDEYDEDTVDRDGRANRGDKRGERNENHDAEGKEDEEGEDEDVDVDVHFARHDILRDPSSALLDFRLSSADGWGVVLDKGTFDAVSLSAETLDSRDAGAGARVSEAYGARVLPLVRPGGLFLITSCNWTEAELRSWFEARPVAGDIPGEQQQQQEENDKEGALWGFDVVGRVEYPSFSFGGVKGQTISSLCFRKVRKSR